MAMFEVTFSVPEHDAEHTSLIEASSRDRAVAIATTMEIENVTRLGDMVGIPNAGFRGMRITLADESVQINVREL